MLKTTLDSISDCNEEAIINVGDKSNEEATVHSETSPLMKKIDAAVHKKIELFQASPARYMMRSIFACLFLTLGTAVAYTLANIGENMIHGLGKILYGLMFSWALVMITYMNAELGTSNMMYMTIGVYRKKITLNLAVKILFTCILFNLIGGILFGFLISLTTPFRSLALDSYFFTSLSGKLEKGTLQVLVDGIFANILVNVAILAPLRMKDDAGKILMIVFVIFIFAFLGYEHVIANFPTFTLGYFTANGGLASLTWGNVLHNLTFAFLGNFIGGGLIIGLTYAWLNKPNLKYCD